MTPIDKGSSWNPYASYQPEEGALTCDRAPRGDTAASPLPADHPALGIPLHRFEATGEVGSSPGFKCRVRFLSWRYLSARMIPFALGAAAVGILVHFGYVVVGLLAMMVTATCQPKDRFVLTEHGPELRRLFVTILVEWKQITSARVVSEPGIERFFGLALRRGIEIELERGRISVYAPNQDVEVLASKIRAHLPAEGNRPAR